MNKTLWNPFQWNTAKLFSKTTNAKMFTKQIEINVFLALINLTLRAFPMIESLHMLFPLFETLSTPSLFAYLFPTHFPNFSLNITSSANHFLITNTTYSSFQLHIFFCGSSAGAFLA